MSVNDKITAHIQAERSRRGWTIPDLANHAAVHAAGEPMTVGNLRARLHAGVGWRTDDLLPFALALGYPGCGEFIAAAEVLSA